MWPVCLPDANTLNTPELPVTVSGWGKSNYDKTDRNPGTNFVSQLNKVSMPIIDMDIWKKGNVYGKDKMFYPVLPAYSLGRSRHLPG